MSIESLSSEDNAKLRHAFEVGIKTTQQIKDLRESLRDTIKAVAEDLMIEVKDINKAIQVAIKDNIVEQREQVDTVEMILQLVGRR